LKAGRTYIVAAVKSGKDVQTGFEGTGLKLFGNNDRYWHSVVRFQKAPSHEADAEDQEIISIMRGDKIREGV